MRQVKRLAQQGLMDPDQEDPFTLFVASTDIRYCYYKDSHTILGNTYGMCVLQVSKSAANPMKTHEYHLMLDYLKLKQDFEALTPNLLARTVETVQGGGLIILLLSQMSSLTQMYSLTMDVHSRLRTEAHQEVAGNDFIAGLVRHGKLAKF